MRQKDDKEFAELLNRLREGKHTEQDIEVLKGRILKVKPVERSDYPMNITHLKITMLKYSIIQKIKKLTSLQLTS